MPCRKIRDGSRKRRMVLKLSVGNIITIQRCTVKYYFILASFQCGIAIYQTEIIWSLQTYVQVNKIVIQFENTTLFAVIKYVLMKTSRQWQYKCLRMNGILFMYYFKTGFCYFIGVGVELLKYRSKHKLILYNNANRYYVTLLWNLIWNSQ